MFEPESYLTDALAVFAQTWVSDFRRHFDLDQVEPPDTRDPGDWATLVLLDEFAKGLAEAAKSLDRTKGDAGAVIERLRHEHHLDLAANRFFVQALEAHLAEDLEDELYHMVRRSLRLAEFLVAISHERARAYLSRVGACYLRGLDTETIVMCGAVLDAALQEEFDDDDVRASGVRCGRYVSMGNRIEFAQRTGRFSKKIADQAFRIASDRNTAVHVAPGASRVPDEVMEGLVGVLSALEPWSNPPP